MDAEVKPDYLRNQMVQLQLKARGIRDKRVLDAFLKIPRNLFVPAEFQHEAYEDHPVSIGYGQTISQPYIVALMVEELGVGPDHRVLDVGAGCGYQSAILSRLCKHVYAIERLPELTERSIATLAGLNVDNVSFITCDGSMGWPEEAPFDRIICGASAPDVPQVWLDQLAPTGRIILPTGHNDIQVLTAIDRFGDRIMRREIAGVRFVRLVGKHGWPE